MDFLLVIAGIAMLVALVYCARRESATTGLYKALGVYGRIKAYLFCDFLCVGCVFLVVPFIASGRGAAYAAMSFFAAILGALACFAVAVLIFLSAKRKCPVELKGDLFKSMLTSGLGVTAKIMVFIFPIIWKLSTPHFREAVDERGNRLLIAENGDVYTISGENVGWMKDNNTYVKRY